MRFSVIPLLLVSLLGCNSNDSTTDEATPDYNELNIQPLGKWETSCLASPLGDFDIELWGVGSYTFTANTIKNEWTYFTDNSCTTPYEGTESLWYGFEGEYSFLRHIESSNGLKANLYQTSYTFLDTLLSLEVGFHFELEKMTQVIEEDGNYYISYAPTYLFVN